MREEKLKLEKELKESEAKNFELINEISGKK